MHSIRAKFLLIFFSLCTVYAQIRQVQVFEPDNYGHAFGASVSIDGNYAIVGCPWDETNGQGSGSAYLYRNNIVSWELVSKLIGSDVDADDEFGFSVAISGDLAVVGAPHAGSYWEGKVYLFRRQPSGAWVETNKFASSIYNEQLGSSVSVSGSRMIIGSVKENAYIYFVSGFLNLTYLEESIVLTDPNVSSATKKVCITGDFAAVGDPSDSEMGNEVGAVHIYQRMGGHVWTFRQKLLPIHSQGTMDWFGLSISFYDNFLVVGAPHHIDNNSNPSGAVYIYERSGLGYSYKSHLTKEGYTLPNDRFGQSVDLSENFLLIGSLELPGPGKAYLYKYDATNWTQHVTPIQTTNPTSGDGFGNCVSMSGGYILVSAPSEFGVMMPKGKAYLFTGFAEEGWPHQVSGTTQELFAFHHKTSAHIVGAEGTILKSTNGGLEWTLQNSGTLKKLYSTFFKNTHEGFAVGEEGTILKTSNEGTNWNQESSGINETLASICFSSETDGWIVGDNGIILHTDDGGTSWTSQQSGTTKNLKTVRCIDSLTVFAAGDDGMIIKTNDAGAVWNSLSIGTDKKLLSLCFVDYNTGWVCGEGGIILKTTNSGQDWNEQNTGTLKSLRSICFNNHASGYAVGGEEGGNGVILKTTDGGDLWEELTGSSDKNLYSVFFRNETSGWTVGEEGTILHTSTGGLTYVEEEKIFDRIPDSYYLSDNYPNPFNPVTTIEYSVPAQAIASPGKFVIKIYDILGNEIETLTNGDKSPGIYKITWHADNLPSGIYFYRLETGDFSETKKMVLLK